ncbi:MAG: alpha/beta hydrolase, partial [Ginsengibacter sp.]
QQQLDAQYNNRLHVPGFADYFERWEKLSRRTEKKQAVFKDVSYGSHPLERLDIFPAANPSAKTLVFIHGGYWHLLDKKLFHFLAPTFLERNVTTVLLNYPLAPSASMDTIVSSCRNALLWLQNNLTNYNGDPMQVYVAGHSAGGHLACMLLVNNNTNFLKGVVSLSGLYDLQPLMLSNINLVLQMDAAMSARNSPAYLKLAHPCPLLLVAGSDETDEFKAQAIKMYESWKDKQSVVQLLNVPAKNHFSILDEVTGHGSILQFAIFRLMEIGS